MEHQDSYGCRMSVWTASISLVARQVQPGTPELVPRMDGSCSSLGPGIPGHPGQGFGQRPTYFGSTSRRSNRAYCELAKHSILQDYLPSMPFALLRRTGGQLRLPTQRLGKT